MTSTSNNYNNFDLWSLFKFMLWVAVFFVVVSMCSCANSKETVQEKEKLVYVTDTMLVYVSDTIWNDGIITDSIIIRDSIVIRMDGESIVGTDRWHNENKITNKDQKQKESKNSGLIQKKNENVVEKEKEQKTVVKKSSAWLQLSGWIGVLILIILWLCQNKIKSIWQILKK